MADRVGPGSLKCVIGWSPHRSLREPLEAALRARMSPADVRHLHGDAFLVYTEASTSDVRDWLTPGLSEGESVFVVEFERWSARGPVADRDWLRARGH